MSASAAYATAPKLAGNRCKCTACGDCFNSDSVFARHRVGPYAKPGEWQGSRRCLTAAEMTSKGWSRNGAGFWIRRAREAVTSHV